MNGYSRSVRIIGILLLALTLVSIFSAVKVGISFEYNNIVFFAEIAVWGIAITIISIMFIKMESPKSCMAIALISMAAYAVLCIVTGVIGFIAKIRFGLFPALSFVVYVYLAYFMPSEIKQKQHTDQPKE